MYPPLDVWFGLEVEMEVVRRGQREVYSRVSVGAGRAQPDAIVTLGPQCTVQYSMGEYDKYGGGRLFVAFPEPPVCAAGAAGVGRSTLSRVAARSCALRRCEGSRASCAMTIGAICAD